MRIVGGISYPSTWLNVYAEHMLDPCALNRKFLPGISLDSGGDQHQTVLAAEVPLPGMPHLAFICLCLLARLVSSSSSDVDTQMARFVLVEKWLIIR